MLLGIGWTISTDQLIEKTVIVVTVVSFAVAHFIILIWENGVRDPAQTNIPRWSGLWLMLNLTTFAWVGLGLWFAYHVFHSYEREYKPAKKELFARLGSIYTPWFLMRPLALALVLMLDPWVREKIVISVSLTVSTVAYLVLAYLLWPTRATNYFEINVPDVSKAVGPYDDL